MDDAIYLGSLSMDLAARTEYKNRFMNLMRDIVSDFIEDATGHRPEWNEPELAPEHERSGNA